MSDHEFDLLDELYFVQHYSYIKSQLGWEDGLILKTLGKLHQQGYIKCLRNPDEELFGKVDLLNEGKELMYLATKKGLMAHNAL